MEFKTQLYSTALLLAQGKRTVEAYLELKPRNIDQIYVHHNLILAAFGMFQPTFQIKALNDAMEMPILIGDNGEPELVIRAVSAAVSMIEAFGVYEIPTTKKEQKST